MKRITGAFIEDFGQMVSTLNELIDAFNKHQEGIYPDVHSTHTTHKETKADKKDAICECCCICKDCVSVDGVYMCEDCINEFRRKFSAIRKYFPN